MNRSHTPARRGRPRALAGAAGWVAVLAALAALAAGRAAAPVAAVAAGAPPPAEVPAAPAPPGVDRQLIALLGRQDAAAVAELKRRFAQPGETFVKQQIAADLLAHGQGEQAHFDFLAGHARKAVETDMPFPFAFDRDGKMVPERYADDFRAWCAERREDPGAAAERAVREMPLDVLFLALASDRRAVDILMAGIRSPNPLVVNEAAYGLARLHWQAAVRPLVELVSRLPKDAALMVAVRLVLFEDPAAQAAAAKVIGDEAMVKALRGDAQRELTRTIGGP